MPISRAGAITLALWAATLALVATADAQGTNGEGGAAWHLDQLQQGFCVQLLVEPAEVAGKLPRGARALPAGRAGDLHPTLKGAVTSQPEFAEWAPSRLCLYYFSNIEAYGRSISEKNPSKAPLLGFWTVAAEDSVSGERRDVALEIVTSRSGLTRWARSAGLDLRGARSSVVAIPQDEVEEWEGEPRGDRYQIRIGKTLLTWDGRPAGDSAPMAAPVTTVWRVEGRGKDWVGGTFTLSGGQVGGMIGSLRVEGKDELASVLKRSPVRFVGPGYRGGSARLELGP